MGLRSEDASVKRPLISVVMPSYNCDAFIRAALESVFVQEYHNLEIIVVDDGSTDDTTSVVRNIMEQYPDNIKLEMQANSGAAAARNHGLTLAQGEYIAFLDSDDVWLPGKLDVQERFLASRPDVGLVCSRYDFLRHGVVEGTRHRRGGPISPDDKIATDLSGWIFDTLFNDCVVWTSTVLVRRSIVDRVGKFDETLRRGQDYDYWLRAARVTPIARLEHVTALYRIRDDSVTRTPHLENFEGLVIRKNTLSQMERTRTGSRVGVLRVRARMFKAWRNFWHEHYQAGNRVQSTRACAQLVRWTPWNPAAWTAVAKTLAMIISPRRR